MKVPKPYENLGGFANQCVRRESCTKLALERTWVWIVIETWKPFELVLIQDLRNLACVQ